MRRISILLFFSLSAFAGGKHSTTDASGCSSGLIGADPIRGVYIQPVFTIPFQLPNGQMVSLAQDLRTMLSTAIAQNSTFRELNGSPSGGYCDQYLEIKAGVTTLDMDLNQIHVKFGYTPSGAIPTVSDVNAEAKVTLGTLSMDFAVRLCQMGKCIVLAAATSDHTLAGVNLNFSVKFDQISTGVDLVLNSNFGKVLRSVMEKGIQKLAEASRAQALPWSAKVILVQSGVFTFDSGKDEMIRKGDRFDIFAPVLSGSFSCGVQQRVGVAEVTDVFATSSDAKIIQSYDRGIQTGDLVMVGTKAN